MTLTSAEVKGAGVDCEETETFLTLCHRMSEILLELDLVDEVSHLAAFITHWGHV